MAVNYQDMTDSQKATIYDYCKNDMKKLKLICNFVWGKKGIPNCYHDDLYDDAINVLSESVITFNPNGKSKFKTYLTNNIRKSYSQWYRDNHLRAKRNNLELDENGKIKKDEHGNPIIIHNVSFDAPTDDGVDLKDKIPAREKTIENDFSPQMKNYLEKLSKVQRKILIYLSDGYSQEEIQNLLHIDKALYKDSIIAIMDEKNKKHIRCLIRR